MTGFDYFKDVITNKYADFDGRARRSEYWYYVLFQWILLMALAMFAGVTESAIFGILYMVAALGFFIPSLAAGVRRLHDIGKSGWMLLIGLVPIIGAIALLVFFVTDSQMGTNAYGPNPKEESTENIQDNLV